MSDSGSDQDYTVETTVSGASDCHPVQCSALRKNGFVVIKGRPCKVVDMSTSKTGKHGHAKVHLVAIDLFTAKKLEELCPSTHNMMVPNVTRMDYTLLDISDDGYLSLIDPEGETKDDLKIPEGELGDQIKKDFAAEKELVVSVLSAMGEQAAVAVRENQK
eukprot:TRINITY_DN6988_c0_g1_i1.p1 TRINITY_DN6988_c0_g1~~TRINITY_DN6988_c0_g1_i1.p1  ORF type:complete len:161 (-),score=36.28 TRINITY_DN6988_c0_g1_i1:40-522(-)